MLRDPWSPQWPRGIGPDYLPHTVDARHPIWFGDGENHPRPAPCPSGNIAMPWPGAIGAVQGVLPQNTGYVLGNAWSMNPTGPNVVNPPQVPLQVTYPMALKNGAF